MAEQLGQSDIVEILRSGRIRDESFSDWLESANQVPMARFLSMLAEYLFKVGLASLKWEQAGPWEKDKRVYVTYLKASRLRAPTRLERELDYLSNSYDWASKDEFSHETQKWENEIWIEYHSAPVQYAPLVRQILDGAKIGDISYAELLGLGGASTDIGVLSKLLTANGILDIHTKKVRVRPRTQWLTYLIVKLPPSTLSTNSNMPPLSTAHLVAMLLRNPHNYFLMKTEVWIPFKIDLPLTSHQLIRLRELRYRSGHNSFSDQRIK